MKTLTIYNPFNNTPIFYVDQTSSTMILAREIAEKKISGIFPFHGTVVMAGFQTAGRGRIEGRRWVGEKNKNLTFTLLLERKMVSPQEMPLPLVAGLGLAFYLERSHFLAPSIKWPNDILVSGKKISGIIIEQIRDFYLVGIGININQILFPETLRSKTTSVRNEIGEILVPQQELSLVLEGIYSALKMNDTASLIEKRLFLRGKKINFIYGDPVHGKREEGILTGVGMDGSLLLQTSDGRIIPAVSGEILF